MSKTRMPSDWSVCATCNYWSGRLTPTDYANYYVEYEANEKSRCTYWNCDKEASTCKCTYWNPRFKKK